MKTSLLLCGVSVASVIASAQDTALWTYADCLAYADSHNISLLKARVSDDVSAIDLEAAKAQWFPTLGFATTHTFTNRPTTPDGATHNTFAGSYGLNASWTVFDGNKRSNAIKRADMQQEVTAYAVEEIRNNIETQILSYYLNALYARDAIVIARQTAEVSKAQRDRAEELVNTGRLSKVDFSQLDAQYQTDVYNVVAAEGTYSSRISQLKQLLTLAIDYDMELAPCEFDEAQVLATVPDKTAVYDAALAWMPQIKGAAVAESQAALDIDMAKASRYPQISLNAGIGTSAQTGINYGYGRQLGDNLNEQIGVTISVPILDQKASKTAVAKAKLDKVLAELNTTDLQNQLSQSVEQYYIEARSNQAKYVSGLESVKSARVNADLLEERFAVGYSNTVELLQAHNQLLNARMELLQSKYMAILSLKMLDFYTYSSIALP